MPLHEPCAFRVQKRLRAKLHGDVRTRNLRAYYKVPQRLRLYYGKALGLYLCWLEAYFVADIVWQYVLCAVCRKRGIGYGPGETEDHGYLYEYSS